LETAETWGLDEEGRPRIVMNLDQPKQTTNAISKLATTLEQRIDRRIAQGPLTAGKARELNDHLARLEQTLLDERDPPDKRWYRHVIYGWNIYALYEGQPLPGLADAARSAEATRVEQEIARISTALERMRSGLEKALATFQ